MPAELKSFKFDLGNSSEGQIGAVIRVKAANETQAAERLKDFLDAIGGEVEVSTRGQDGLEYCTVYFGNITAAHIDLGDTLDVEADSANVGG